MSTNFWRDVYTILVALTAYHEPSSSPTYNTHCTWSNNRLFKVGNYTKLVEKYIKQIGRDETSARVEDQTCISPGF